MAKRKKKILFVYAQLKTGGIETLILKMTKWLSSRGHYVTLFIYGGGGEGRELSEELIGLKNVKLIINKDIDKTNTKLSKLINLLVIGARFIYYLVKYTKKENYDLVYSFNPESFLLSYLFHGKVYLSGVYYCPAYNQDDQHETIKYLSRVDNDFYKKLVAATPSIKNTTEKYIHNKINEFIFPIAIDYKIKKNKNIEKNYKSRKIISIGRIVDFKTYNFYMVGVMEKLIKKYPNLEYHIYGFGKDENKLLKKIRKSKAQKNIYFHGPVNYSKFSETLTNAFCFIGSGTSLIEAAYSGIPTIVAVNYIKKARTPGYLYEIPEFETGDMTNIKLKYDVERVISKLLKTNKKEYRNECIKCQNHVKEFEINTVMKQFLSFVDNCHEEKNKNKLSISEYLSFFIKYKIEHIRKSTYLT